MKRGDLVEYTHWHFDPLVLTEPNEVGKMLVLFGKQKMWVWSGDLSLKK